MYPASKLSLNCKKIENGFKITIFKIGEAVAQEAELVIY